MRTYVYCRRALPEEGINVEIRVTANRAAAARRRLETFVEERRPFLGRAVPGTPTRIPMETSEMPGDTRGSRVPVESRSVRTATPIAIVVAGPEHLLRP
jgi:hypothetical protein